MSLSTIILNTVFAVFLATDIVGNTMVLLVLIKYECVMPAMKYLLLNMAVADMMVGVFFAPGVLLMPMSAHPTGTTGDVMCKILTGKNVAWLASFESVFSLVVVAVERFYAIVDPLSIRQKITKGKIAVLIPCSWILATLVTLPSFLADRFVEKSHSCSEWLPRQWQNVLYASLWIASAGVVPVGIMISLYSIVFYTLWFKHNTSDASSSQVVIKTRRKITKMMISVSVIYALCCLPTHILYYVYVFHPNLFPPDNLFFPISYHLMILNSAINPFVYSFQCTEFRKGCKRMFCKAQGGQMPNKSLKTVTSRLRYSRKEHETRL